MTGFFEEVQRRKVYRVAVAYVIAAGGIIQLASAAFPAWELPNWALRLVIVLLLIGFPIALILAWAFDVTPTGIRATPAPVVEGRPRRRNLLVLVAIGILVSAAAGFFLLPRAIAHRVEKSIAVLPFENLSDDKENAYFADGVQDELLTNLSKIGDLKVTSRTSVMRYRGQTQDIRQIGKALGVATILEGSVRRVGNQVRINVQLIDAQTDQHIWAQDYDGDLTSVFKVQTEFAEKIADALQAKLSPGEKEQLSRASSNVNGAQLAYQEAHTLEGNHQDLQKLKQAEAKYDEAIRFVPKFALAMARYSFLESWIYHSFEKTPEHRDKARNLAQQALTLDSTLAEAHLAQGFVKYYVDSDFDAAALEFEIARQGLPNDAEVYLALGAIERRQGKWDQSTANLEKAVRLNPNDSWTMHNLAMNYEMQRDFKRAEDMIDRAIKVNPADPTPWEVKMKILIEARGDLENAQRLLDQFNGSSRPELQQKVAVVRANIFLLQRKYSEALGAAQNIPDLPLTTDPADACTKHGLIGHAKSKLGDLAGAKEAYLKARDAAQAQVQKDPDNAFAYGNLALAEAFLQNRDAALSAMAQAEKLLPESKDSFNGPDISETAAEVHATLGDAAGAVSILQGLLTRPSPVTIQMLKINPAWDSIRQDPAFQKLITEHESKA
jgi:TolB-like protein/Tfp pilus assembly protein PilF